MVCFTAYASTGESASPASSLPEARAAVASLWASYWSILIAGLPASVHFFDRAVTSSTCTVPFCTATDRPHAFSGSAFFGLPFFVAHWVPAE